MHEVKANENEEEKKASGDNFGWGKMESKAKDINAEVKEDAKKTAQATPGGEINFTKGRPPMFTKKNKGLGLAQEEFPELGDIAATGSKGQQNGSDANVPKANSASIGQFGAMAQERDGGYIPDKPRQPATKPMFKGKAKLNLGGANDVDTK